MKYIILFSSILFFIPGFSQTINLNENHIENYLRNLQLIEKSDFLGGLGETLALSNDYKCESYYHHFFKNDVYLIKLCKRFS